MAHHRFHKPALLFVIAGWAGIFALNFVLLLTPRSTLASDTALDRFKQYLTNTPTINEMVAEICKRSDSATTTNGLLCYYVLLRYQTNAFFYREAPSLGELISTNLFPHYSLAGYFDNDYWSYSFDSHILASSTNANETGMKAALENVLAKASMLLNFGFDDCVPGQIAFTGNMVKPFTNLRGVRINGELVASQNNLPESLTLAITLRDGRTFPWLVKYAFATHNFPDFMPSTVTVTAFPGAKDIPVAQIRIFTATLGSSPLSKDYFVPNAYLKYRTTRILKTKTTGYVLDPRTGIRIH